MTAAGARLRRGRVLNYLILFLFVAFALGPIVNVVFNSLKTQAEIGRNPLGPPAAELHFENYPRAWEYGEFGTTVRNSLILVAGTVAGILLFGGMAAYSMAKLHLPAAATNVLLLYLLVMQSLPIHLSLVPLFWIFRVIGLVNTHVGVILIYLALNSPFSIFLMRSYFLQIPDDFRDAARLDGANEMQILYRVMVPMAWPVFLTVGLVNALFVWSEFMIVRIFLIRGDLFTVVTSYFRFATAYGRDWGLTSAGAVMMIFPIVVTFLLLQRRFIQGLTQGGVKG